MKKSSDLTITANKMLVQIKAFVIVIIVVNMTAMALHWPVIWHYTVIYPPQSKYLLSTVEANMVFFQRPVSITGKLELD